MTERLGAGGLKSRDGNIEFGKATDDTNFSLNRDRRGLSSDIDVNQGSSISIVDAFVTGNDLTPARRPPERRNFPKVLDIALPEFILVIAQAPVGLHASCLNYPKRASVSAIYGFKGTY